jgi:hypothetical protein
MKSTIIIMMLITVLLTSCSVIDTYFPTTTNTSNLSDSEMIDSFELILDNSTTLLELTPLDESLNISDENLLFTIKVKEGEKVYLNIEAKDPDGDEINYKYSTPFDDEGVWQTQIGDAGSYIVTVSASDGLLTTTEAIKVVVDAVNRPPVITCPLEFTVKEGEFLEIPCSFADPEGAQVDYKVVGFISSLTYQTTYDDAGEYSINIVASDGLQSSMVEVKLTIENTNRAPSIILTQTEFSLTEEESLSLTVNAEDVDGNEVTITYPEQFNNQGVWQTQIGDAGTHELKVIASDGELETEATFKVNINQINLPPVIEIDDVLTYKETDLIQLPVIVTDPNGDEVTISANGFMKDLTYQTTYDDAGEYELTITASDGLNTVSKTITVIIENVNRPPQFIFD